MKNQEELGEVSEAFLNLTDGVNAKGLTPADLAEEVTDVFLVTTDALQQFRAYLDASGSAAARPMHSACNHLDAVAAVQPLETFMRTFASLSQSHGSAFDLCVNGASGESPFDEELAGHLLSMHRSSSLLLLTAYPGMPPRSLGEMKARVLQEIDRKIEKWVRVRAPAIEQAA
ncbi:hypothetical protein AS149_14615 [Burkholderia cenocepacia]|nr:hypothetical protein AS149_14615 [Burkholderia cenocepacia]